MKQVVVFLLPFVLLIGCLEVDNEGTFTDKNITETTSECEGNISITKTVDFVKEHNLTYNNENFTFSFDGINDYDTDPDTLDSGVYDLDVTSTDSDDIKNFSFKLTDDGDLTLSGDMTGTIDFYCLEYSDKA
ncbi:MAG: hypothetical protein OIF32_07515, partial [Campylobacterales bacterium]|nr:hypothetical protein [Campylobacterales bacterium]